MAADDPTPDVPPPPDYGDEQPAVRQTARRRGPPKSDRRAKPFSRRRIFQIVNLSLALVLTLAVAAYAWGVSEFNAAGPSSLPLTVELPRGLGLRGIARRLNQAGVLRYAQVFNIAVRLNRKGRALKAGEYAFAAAVSPKSVMEKLLAGDTVVHRLTIAEGLQTAQILDLIGSADVLKGEALAVGQPAPPEGSLLPETYHFARGDDRAGLLARMRRDMAAVLAAAWAGRAAGLPFKTPQEVLVLASIVEKETSLAHERRHVAGVFINRLRRGMRLQSDPTVAYGLSPDAPLARALTRADLKTAHPFNTYIHTGLPPSPISTPGRAAIEAVLQPMATDDLYFVADGAGGHVFASTLVEHNKNVARWRKLQRERKAN